MTRNLFDIIMMLRFGKTKLTKEKFFDAKLNL